MKYSFNRTIIALLLAAAFVLAALSSCGESSHQTLEVISGSENKTLEPLIQEFARENNCKINMHYKGSVDMMLQLGNEEFPYDAVWPANSLWISLGDSLRRVKYTKSIMTSPVVFGIRESVARELGFVDTDVYVQDILEVIRSGELSFMMTSATQSNSGASAYLGFLYALSGSEDVITLDTLADPDVRRDIRDLLGGINRSSGSSGWLKELFLESDYDAMVNYEAVMIETNQELTSQGREPLHIIYPVDGIVIADSPLGYVNKGLEEKEALFLQLQEYLLSKEVQDQISGFGRRTGLGGITAGLDSTVFREDWGIDAQRPLAPIRMPGAEVIREALKLYQTAFRKPSYTVFALDYSGSMSGSNESEMKMAMETLLDSQIASQYMIETGEEDIIKVIPFSSDVLLSEPWAVSGNNSEDLLSLYESVVNLSPAGGTDIYLPIIAGLQVLADEPNLDDYMPAIILLTDGEHTEYTEFDQFRFVYDKVGLDIPVFSIVFGGASESELEEISEYTRGRVFDGRKDLIAAFRKVKGYN